MSAILSILGICWLAVGVSFWMPAFRNKRQFKSIDELRRLRNQDGPLTHSLADEHIGEPHIASEPHGDLAPRYSSQFRRAAPEPSLIHIPEQELVVANASTGVYFDSWTNSYITEDGEPATTPSAPAVELNPRAVAYARPVAANQRPITRPVSAQRQAAMRRRQVLKWMGIAISSTTLPALLTGWGIFVTLSVMSWLAFGAWFSLMIYFLNEQSQSKRVVDERETVDIPDNVVPMRRRAASAPAAAIADLDETFTPTAGSGFAPARYAVGE